MWVPDWLYRLLPFLYAMAGAMLLPALGLNSATLLSAAMLLGASLLTLVWRRAHRPAPQDPARAAWAERRARRQEALPKELLE